jgi:class 3 adenylate cyclase
MANEPDPATRSGAASADGAGRGTTSRASRAAQLARTQWLLGIGVTLIVSALQFTGLTRGWELPLFDVRSRLFTRFNPPVSSEVATVLIDDQSIQTMGKWPWPRSLVAIAVDELRRAGASVVAFDLLFDDAQAPELRRDASAPGGIATIDHDQELARAMREHGGVVQAASFDREAPPSTERSGESGMGERAHFSRVLEAVSLEPQIAPAHLRERLLPDAAPQGAEMDDLLRKHRGARLMVDRRAEFSLALETAGFERPRGAAWPESNRPSMPVDAIGHAAARIASVSFGAGDSDSGVRRIPLLVQARDRLYPTLALGAVLQHLGVPVERVRAEAQRVVIPLEDGRQIVLPTHRGRLRGLRELGELTGLAYVPWPRGGFGGWKDQFARQSDTGEWASSDTPIGRLLDPVLTIMPRIRQNVQDLDRNMLAVGELFGLLDAEAYRASAAQMAALMPDDPAWAALLEAQRSVWTKAASEAAGLLEQALASGVDRASMSEQEQAALNDLEQVSSRSAGLIKAIDDGLRLLTQWRQEELPRRVRGKIVFVGWSATGALADFVPTPIDARTPGVLVHAALASAMHTSRESPQLIMQAPAWADALVVVGLGLAGTLLAIRFGVVFSPLALVVLGAAWFALDGWILWDFGNWFVAQAAPLIAATASWLAVILHRLLVEQRGRRQTEARFRSYVSSEVVDILVNNPGLSSMVPVRRELTIFFSDIANWTTLAERLGTEGIGTFLATYLKAMTDILQSNRATIDKYLGDGIMAFWGAPVADADHARHAVAAVLEMQDRLDEMNAAGAFGPAGAIAVRIGLASGEVNVGDFGNPPAKSAYTVIGDAANLAARLESANKQFGSRTLMSGRVRELTGDAIPARLIGRVVVKGKTEPETLYEPIGTRRPKGPRTEEWITLTNQATQAYISGDFPTARRLLARLQAEFDEGPLAEIYEESMEAIERAGGPGLGFDGALVLKEK